MSRQHRIALLSAACLLAPAALLRAADTTAPRLSLNPSALLADDSDETQGLLMSGLDKLGAAKPLTDAGINIYGWVESGYTYLHRHHRDELIIPGPFNNELHNHYMLNQVVLRFERTVDASKAKFDVGGLIELMYGSDAARMHSTGLGFDGSDPTDDGQPNDPDSATTIGGRPVVTNVNPTWQFDIPQAYVDLAIPVGNGLTLRIGKFTSLLGYEATDPRDNLFYSHSYLYSATPFTNTGILGFYKFNDQWAVAAGISRGWEISLEDNNGCAIDGLGQIVYTPNKQWTFTLNWTTGPENSNDSSHYRTVIDPIIAWQATDKLTLALETFYLYDGGINGDAAAGASHAYGDIWGAALYASYQVNDYLTVNGRFEKCHSYVSDFAGISTSSLSSSIPTINAYEITLGATIKPLPKDPLGKNLSVRPEVRYDFSEDPIFPVNGGAEAFKDQLTFGADVLVTF